jgi:simple sugar transport system ATP-binding protein
VYQDQPGPEGPGILGLPAARAETVPLLEMRGITKRFGDVIANDGIDLMLAPGDILGLLGENGAGKTTLMNILFGAYEADAGTIAIDGKPVRIANSADALAQGVGMVHQHFHLGERLSVLENLMVGQRGILLDRGAARARLGEIAERYGLALPPARLVAGLTVGERQRLEILKALFRGARVLILDEPTAVLTPIEVEGLFKALRAMAAQGLGIIFISHKLNEIRAVTNRVMVLRHGKVTGQVADVAGVAEAELARMMCGRDIVPPSRTPPHFGDCLLSVDGITTGGHAGMPLHAVSLAARGGEILGIAGVSGNGQGALAEIISGILRPRSGSLSIGGTRVRHFTPLEVQALGLGRIPEDRMTAGLVTTLPLADSMVLPRIRNPPFSRYGLLRRRAIVAFAERQIAAFDIRCAGPLARAGSLSGGNLQKALLARELAFDPRVLLAAQPTRGLDIGAARFVHEQFLAMRSRGRALILISEDLEELLSLSDRIAVLYEGRIMGVLDIAEASVARVGLLMSGVAETGP